MQAMFILRKITTKMKVFVIIDREDGISLPCCPVGEQLARSQRATTSKGEEG